MAVGAGCSPSKLEDASKVGFFIGGPQTRICTVGFGGEEQALGVGAWARAKAKGRSCRIRATSTRQDGSCVYDLACSPQFRRQP